MDLVGKHPTLCLLKLSNSVPIHHLMLFFPLQTSLTSPNCNFYSTNGTGENTGIYCNVINQSCMWVGTGFAEDLKETRMHVSNGHGFILCEIDVLG